MQFVSITHENYVIILNVKIAVKNYYAYFTTAGWNLAIEAVFSICNWYVAK